MKTTNLKKTAKKAFYIISVLAILYVFLTNLGRIKAMFTKDSIVTEKESFEKTVETFDYPDDGEILAALTKAHDEAYQYAASELDKWIEDTMLRADDDFMDDYFSFLNVKKREILSLYHYVAHFFVEEHDTAEEAAMKELEAEITNKIIKPEIAQARIKNITDQTVNVYLSAIDNELAKLQEAHKSPTPNWNRYISDICGITAEIENKEYPVAFKTMVVSGVALAGMAITPIVSNIARKVSIRIAERNAAKVGAKVAGEVAVKAGATAAGKGAAIVANAIPYIGWGITAAICIWDIIDYSTSAREGKEQLRSGLEEYFREVRTELLGATEDSIMGSIILWENNLKQNISKHLQ